MYTDIDGNTWYKGNLHTHTRRSDGRREPGETLDLYADAGYDFIALTDHWVQSPENESDRLLTLSGIELDRSVNVREGIFHIVGIGMNKPLDTHRELYPAQKLIEMIREAGGEAILAHPAWSINTPGQILPLENLLAFEIFNSVSDAPHNGRPYSGEVADMIYSAGKLLKTVASDDSHFYDGEQCRSFIWVKAGSCDRESILEALRKGDFYSTQGPRFSCEYGDGVVTVHTTPVGIVKFLSDSVWASDRCTVGNGVTEAVYHVKPGDTYVRVELTDAEGRRGWSNPIKIRDID